MGIYVIALCALVFVGIIGLAVWARRHPKDMHTPDAGGNTEAEWQNAIR